MTKQNSIPASHSASKKAKEAVYLLICSIYQFQAIEELPRGGGRGSGLKEYMVKKDLKFLFSLGVNKKKKKRREEKRFLRN